MYEMYFGQVSKNYFEKVSTFFLNFQFFIFFFNFLHFFSFFMNTPIFSDSTTRANASKTAPRVGTETLTQIRV